MKPLVIQQKITAFVNRYEVYEKLADGKGSLLLFVEQKRLAFKEEITFYSESSKSTEAFRVKAEKVMDIHGKFNVTAPDGTVLAAVRKVFKASLLRSTWQILDSQDAVLCTVTEKSKGLALFRRIWAWIPYIGDIPFFIKYHFIFTDPQSGDVVAIYKKTTRFRDHYELEPVAQTQDVLDWRVVAAQCVLLDALQGR